MPHMCKISLHGMFLGVHPGVKYLSKWDHISHKCKSPESMNLPWKYEHVTLLQKHSAQKLPLHSPLHANNLRGSVAQAAAITTGPHRVVRSQVGNWTLPSLGSGGGILAGVATIEPLYSGKTVGCCAFPLPVTSGANHSPGGAAKTRSETHV